MGRFDVNYATMSLARFNMAPREGHFKEAVRILGFLKVFSKGRILLDTIFQTIPSIRQSLSRTGRISILTQRRISHMTC